MNCAHSTGLGQYYTSRTEDFFSPRNLAKFENSVQLILTSPPFPLNHKKKYGNKNGERYVKWLSNFAPLFTKLLRDDGSIVIEIGHGWEPGRPVQSLLHLEALLAFVNNCDVNLRLCQEFICYNPSRMPSPAQWVTVERTRVTDSYTHIWWIAKSDNPKADNRKVLRPYSTSMKKLLESRKFNAGKRPSGFNVRTNAFSEDHGGSIAHNLFEYSNIDENREARLPNAFSFANTASADFFSRTCKDRNIQPHPARMPAGLVNFFVQFLTDPGDLVVDPFAGSNTTGYVAEAHGRRWLSIEENPGYAEQSMIRFEDPALTTGVVA